MYTQSFAEQASLAYPKDMWVKKHSVHLHFGSLMHLCSNHSANKL